MPDYRKMARDAARRHNIDPEIFLRQIQQESNFEPNARSGAGAQGIAQIVPKHHPGVDPFDPAAALDYAAKWMRDLLTQFGDYALALAAYNAGPGAVQKYGGVPPFDETQTYVRTILGSKAAGGAPDGDGGEDVPDEIDALLTKLLGGSATTAKPTATPTGSGPKRQASPILDLLQKAKGPFISASQIGARETDDPNAPPGVGDLFPKVPNARPRYRYMWGDGTYLDVEEDTIIGGTALEALKSQAAEKPPAGTVLGGQTPNEKHVVIAKPDGTLIVRDNPNYVPPKEGAPEKPQFITHDGTLYQVRPDGSLTVAQARVDRPPAAPQRAPRYPDEEESAQLDLEAKRRKLMPAALLALQEHAALVQDLQDQWSRGEIDEKQRDAYAAASQQMLWASLRGTTPAAEAIQKQRVQSERRAEGRSLINQRLQSGASLATTLVNSALNSNTLMPAGKSSIGYNPFQAATRYTDELTGGDLTPFARRLMMDGEEGGAPGMPGGDEEEFPTTPEAVARRYPELAAAPAGGR